MKSIKKIKTKINTHIIDKIYVYADEIKKIEAKKHLYNSKEKELMRLRCRALREVIGEFLALRAHLNHMFDIYIYEGVIK